MSRAVFKLKIITHFLDIILKFIHFTLLPFITSCLMTLIYLFSSMQHLLILAQ